MKPNLTKVFLGGLAGTAAMTLMMYFAAPMMLGRPMDIAAMLGSVMGGSWALGMLAHVMNGVVVFPLVFAFLAAGLLPGSATVKGIGWGVVLWLAAQLVVMPMMGAGLFSAKAGGMMAAAASLIGHAVYGGLLGAIGGAAPAGAGLSAARAADDGRSGGPRHDGRSSPEPLRPLGDGGGSGPLHRRPPVEGLAVQPPARAPARRGGGPL